MRFGKSVERERDDRLHNLILRLLTNSVFGHAAAQASFDRRHLRLRTFIAHGAAQFFGFASAEISDHHRHAQQLFLE